MKHAVMNGNQLINPVNEVKSLSEVIYVRKQWFISNAARSALKSKLYKGSKGKRECHQASVIKFGNHIKQCCSLASKDGSTLSSIRSRSHRNQA